MDKPILLLDIDGTINPFTTNGWGADEWNYTMGKTPDGLWWNIQVATPVINFFTRLHELDVVDIRWHTEWQNGAHSVGANLGLPRFRLQDAQPRGPISRSRTWKREAVRFLVEAGRKVIWVDDEAHGEQVYGSVMPWGAMGLEQPHLHYITKLLKVEKEVMDMDMSQP